MDFAKATSLRPDNNEMEIMQGYLCLVRRSLNLQVKNVNQYHINAYFLKKSLKSPPEPLLQWIASTAIPEQEHIQYQETAKRTRNGKSSPECRYLAKIAEESMSALLLFYYSNRSRQESIVNCTFHPKTTNFKFRNYIHSAQHDLIFNS